MFLLYGGGEGIEKLKLGFFALFVIEYSAYEEEEEKDKSCSRAGNDRSALGGSEWSVVC